MRIGDVFIRLPMFLESTLVAWIATQQYMFQHAVAYSYINASTHKRFSCTIDLAFQPETSLDKCNMHVHALGIATVANVPCGDVVHDFGQLAQHKLQLTGIHAGKVSHLLSQLSWEIELLS